MSKTNEAKKMNFKEIAFLLKESQYNESVNLVKYIKKYSKGVGTIAATRILYFELLDRSLNKPPGNDDSNWIRRPKNGLATPDSICEWIIDINLKGLLDYFSKTTLRNAFQSLYKSGLIFIDSRNSIHVKFPMNEKMLSPKFAFIAILSQKKKLKEKTTNSEKKLDKKDEKEYDTESENVIGENIDWASM